MTKGQVVKVLLYGGGKAARRVISDRGSTIVICSEQEYQQAEKEGREPVGLGFPLEDVVEMEGDIAPKKQPHREGLPNTERGAMSGD